MSDLEMFRLCAEAMEYPQLPKINHPDSVCGPYYTVYDPLHSDGEILKLIKRFRLESCVVGTQWHVWSPIYPDDKMHSVDYYRAICECVANVQSKRHSLTRGE